MTRLPLQLQAQVGAFASDRVFAFQFCAHLSIFGQRSTTVILSFVLLFAHLLYIFIFLFFVNLSYLYLLSGYLFSFNLLIVVIDRMRKKE